MTKNTSDYPLVIVGAGAAGLGASEQAGEMKINHIVLEASHRTGGRGLTEYLEGKIPVDLGCHWMHSASINPYVEWANRLGFDYETTEYEYSMHFSGNWLPEKKQRQFEEFQQTCDEQISNLYQTDPGASILDAIDAHSEWSQHYFYWISLLHSNDVDQVALSDVVEPSETNENWPLKDGYGELISRQGENCPVELNTEVQSIRWNKNPVKITTSKGSITTDRAVITVSTGVLGADQIQFQPELPEAKQEAIHALPMGNSNYQFFTFEENAFDKDTPENIHFQDGDISMAIRIRPFNTPCLFTSTGGRFAWWLEKQGPQASREYLSDALVKIFGGHIRDQLREFKVSAWGFDPLIRGAYSSQKPGKTGMRTQLSEPVNQCLFFAGEATSTEALNCAHGAYLSGKRAVIEAFSG